MMSKRQSVGSTGGISKVSKSVSSGSGNNGYNNDNENGNDEEEEFDNDNVNNKIQNLLKEFGGKERKRKLFFALGFAASLQKV